MILCIYLVENSENYGLYVIANDIQEAINLYIKALKPEQSHKVVKAELINAIKKECIQGY